MVHDFAACQEPICQLCEAYAIGYAIGKEKAHLEIRAWTASTPIHAAVSLARPSGRSIRRQAIDWLSLQLSSSGPR